MSLGVNTDGDNNSKDNRCFYDVDPQCALRKSQNNICCRHDFTHQSNWTIQILHLDMGITI
jgi:hypothetical protein